MGKSSSVRTDLTAELLDLPVSTVLLNDMGFSVSWDFRAALLSGDAVIASPAELTLKRYSAVQ